MTLALPAFHPDDSWLARRDGRWRLIAFIGFVVAASLGTAPGSGVIFLLAAGLSLVLARVPRRRIAVRIGLLVLGVVPLVAVGQLVGPSESPVIVIFRVMAIGLAALALVQVAPLAETFTHARAIGVPRVLCETGRVADRQGMLLASELRRTRVALRTRGFRVRTSAHSYRTLGYSFAGLLLRAETRAERVSMAMRTRGYSGRIHATRPSRTGVADLVLILGVGLVVAAAFWLDRAGP